jgi:hypothetical protein
MLRTPLKDVSNTTSIGTSPHSLLKGGQPDTVKPRRSLGPSTGAALGLNSSRSISTGPRRSRDRRISSEVGLGRGQDSSRRISTGHSYSRGYDAGHRQSSSGNISQSAQPARNSGGPAAGLGLCLSRSPGPAPQLFGTHIVYATSNDAVPQQTGQDVGNYVGEFNEQFPVHASRKALRNATITIGAVSIVDIGCSKICTGSTLKLVKIPVLKRRIVAVDAQVPPTASEQIHTMSAMSQVTLGHPRIEQNCESFGKLDASGAEVSLNSLVREDEPQMDPSLLLMTSSPTVLASVSSRSRSRRRASIKCETHLRDMFSGYRPEPVVADQDTVTALSTLTQSFDILEKKPTTTSRKQRVSKRLQNSPVKQDTEQNTPTGLPSPSDKICTNVNNNTLVGADSINSSVGVRRDLLLSSCCSIDNRQSLQPCASEFLLCGGFDDTVATNIFDALSPCTLPLSSDAVMLTEPQALDVSVGEIFVQNAEEIDAFELLQLGESPVARSAPRAKSSRRASMQCSERLKEMTVPRTRTILPRKGNDRMRQQVEDLGSAMIAPEGIESHVFNAPGSAASEHVPCSVAEHTLCEEGAPSKLSPVSKPKRKAAARKIVSKSVAEASATIAREVGSSSDDCPSAEGCGSEDVALLLREADSSSTSRTRSKRRASISSSASKCTKNKVRNTAIKARVEVPSQLVSTDGGYVSCKAVEYLSADAVPILLKDIDVTDGAQVVGGFASFDAEECADCILSGGYQTPAKSNTGIQSTSSAKQAVGLQTPKLPTNWKVLHPKEFVRHIVNNNRELFQYFRQQKASIITVVVGIIHHACVQLLDANNGPPADLNGLDSVFNDLMGMMVMGRADSYSQSCFDYNEIVPSDKSSSTQRLVTFNATSPAKDSNPATWKAVTDESSRLERISKCMQNIRQWIGNCGYDSVALVNTALGELIMFLSTKSGADRLLSELHNNDNDYRSSAKELADVRKTSALLHSLWVPTKIQLDKGAEGANAEWILLSAARAMLRWWFDEPYIKLSQMHQLKPPTGLEKGMYSAETVCSGVHEHLELNYENIPETIKKVAEFTLEDLLHTQMLFTTRSGAGTGMAAYFRPKKTNEMATSSLVLQVSSFTARFSRG